MWFKDPKSLRVPTATEALPGRDTALAIPARHHVLPASLTGPFPDGSALALFGMGCFWGAERMFWRLPGVISTAVGYAGGHTPNPTYEEVCSGLTGHTEVVRVAYNPAQIAYEILLRTFWEGHDPTQGMRQGNDVGTQYRSLLGWYDEQQRDAAEASSSAYQHALTQAGFGSITTEIVPAPTFYFAEGYHQQYLHTHPNGYCGHGGTDVACPIGVGVSQRG
jgi:peptide-methionine (S)-S-oxide reductase